MIKSLRLKISIFITLILLVGIVKGQENLNNKYQSKEITLNYIDCSISNRFESQWKGVLINILTNEEISPIENSRNIYDIKFGHYKLKLITPYNKFEYSHQLNISNDTSDSINICKDKIEAEILEKTPVP